MFKCDLILLEKTLNELKIPKHSTIIIHSSLFKFGIIEGGVEFFFNMLKRVFDNSYTLIMPTFTFSYGLTRKWDCIHSKSET